MSKFYAQYRRQPRVKKPWRVHPIWRGIGCLLIVIVPLLSYGLADLAIRANLRRRWFEIPSDLAGPSYEPYLFAKLIMTAVVLVTIFGISTFVYALIYRILGPSPYGPMDEPPIRR